MMEVYLIEERGQGAYWLTIAASATDAIVTTVKVWETQGYEDETAAQFQFRLSVRDRMGLPDIAEMPRVLGVYSGDDNSELETI